MVLIIMVEFEKQKFICNQLPYINIGVKGEINIETDKFCSKAGAKIFIINYINNIFLDLRKSILL